MIIYLYQVIMNFFFFPLIGFNFVSSTHKWIHVWIYTWMIFFFFHHRKIFWCSMAFQFFHSWSNKINSYSLNIYVCSWRIINICYIELPHFVSPFLQFPFPSTRSQHYRTIVRQILNILHTRNTYIQINVQRNIYIYSARVCKIICWVQ